MGLPAHAFLPSDERQEATNSISVFDPSCMLRLSLQQDRHILTGFENIIRKLRTRGTNDFCTENGSPKRLTITDKKGKKSAYFIVSYFMYQHEL